MTTTPPKRTSPDAAGAPVSRPHAIPEAPSTDGLGLRWRNLRVDETAAGLDVGETITARTFATPSDPGQATPHLLPITLPSLPHISLSDPDGVRRSMRDPSGRALAPPGADLEITGLLGEGGMGRVLLARQKSLLRTVAVKTLKPDVDDRAALEGLLVEAVITGSLEHPSVVPVHALGCDDEGRPILVMKRIEGVSWKTLAADDRHPAWARIDAGGDDRLVSHLEILMQVANAIHFAHSRGFVHRDIKLANVMIGEFGEVYVVDWGLAVKMGATRPGDEESPLVGTPVYMAPEMLSGDPALVDARTDVYLLGATLHAVLTGAPRHRGAGFFEVLVAAGASLPYEYGPDVPAELAAICNKATSADPGARYQTAREFRRAIAGYLRHRGAIALSDSAAARLAELRALEAGGHAVDPQRAYALLTQSRFGFEQALRAWKDNAAARKGIQECIERMIEHELARRDAEGARALYAELPEPRPEIERRLDALAVELRESAERDARLVAMDRDLDLRVGSRARVTAVTLLGVLATVLLVTLPWRQQHAVGSRRIILVMVVVNAAMLSGAAALRKQLFANAIGRRLAAVPFTWGVTSLIGRVIAAQLGVSAAQTLAYEMWSSAGLYALGALAVHRHMAWAALPFAAGALLSIPRPEMAPYVYDGMALLASLVMLVVFRNELKQPRDDVRRAGLTSSRGGGSPRA